MDGGRDPEIRIPFRTRNLDGEIFNFPQFSTMKVIDHFLFPGSALFVVCFDEKEGESEHNPSHRSGDQLYGCPGEKDGSGSEEGYRGTWMSWMSRPQRKKTSMKHSSSQTRRDPLSPETGFGGHSSRTQEDTTRVPPPE